MLFLHTSVSVPRPPSSSHSIPLRPSPTPVSDAPACAHWQSMTTATTVCNAEEPLYIAHNINYIITGTIVVPGKTMATTCLYPESK